MWRDPRPQNERATLHNERPANRAVGSRCARRVGGTGAQSKKEQRSDEHISDSVHTQIPFPEGLELHYARLCRRLIGSPIPFIGHSSATSRTVPKRLGDHLLVDLLDMATDRMLELVGQAGGPLADASLWHLEVVDTGPLSPTMQRMVLTAPGLDGLRYVAGQDLMLRVPRADGNVTNRRYTIRSFDSTRPAVTIDVSLHGAGPGLIGSARPGSVTGSTQSATRQGHAADGG